MPKRLFIRNGGLTASRPTPDGFTVLGSENGKFKKQVITTITDISSGTNKAIVTFTPGTVSVANTITHDLGTSSIIVQLWDVVNNEVIGADMINNATSTTVDITFTTNPSGDVMAIII